MINALTTTMTDLDTARVEVFVRRWEKAGGKERANYQMFFAEMCDALGVDRPNPQGGPIAYGFDHSMTFYTPSGKKTAGYIDFYKENHFVIEAKQGSEKSGSGTTKRGTQGYLKAMEGAFVQAVSYARNVGHRPPFVLTCDIGSHFELWLGFGGDYGGYGARREIGVGELVKPEIFGLFVDIFTNPQARNPEKIAAIVTREVAADLADLARSLERSPLAPLGKGGTGEDRPQEVAQFLMRCIFTMFAEDLGLLKEQLFTETLSDRWLKNPGEFRAGAEDLWAAMNEGSKFGFYGRLLRFNGGLFANPRAFDLTREQLEVLLRAARKDWRNVEPAIFGTLLERALDSRERSKLGAHYTPRSYVERLVRPVVMEPLRDRWEIVQAEVNLILGDGEVEPTKKQVKDARSVLDGFLLELRSVRVLDPACGSGNFLYVTLDLMKQLETEVFRRLADVVGMDQLRLDIEQVGPAQFLGIELNPRAAAIADLVIWIGYLQWHFRRFGEVPPIEPVLREYKNIECRDAVLEWDDRVLDVDRDGRVRTRWGGRMVKSPVTGEDVPDATDQVTIFKYVNARQADWFSLRSWPSPQPSPEGRGGKVGDELSKTLTPLLPREKGLGDEGAIYVVSNPPFIGNARMREMLGDGYTEALRKVYKDVPDTVDFVMYWWHKAAEFVRGGKVDRFGLITTNSIRQIWQRQVLDTHLQASLNPLNLFFAIADHPWDQEGAAVRIAMTAAELACHKKVAIVGHIDYETDSGLPEDLANDLNVNWKYVDAIFSNLETGQDLSSAQKLKSNQNLSSKGMMLGGQGFLLARHQLKILGYDSIHKNSVIKLYRNGRDFVQPKSDSFVIDLFGLTEDVVRTQYPLIYQWILERVKPERMTNNRKSYRDNWWIFSEARAKIRPAINSLTRYIATPRTTKHRFFIFLDTNVFPESEVIMIALEDSYHFGILSSRLHSEWALGAGGDLGGNTPRYNNSVCFDPFPFPDPTEPQKQKIRELGDRLDAHRKRVQAANPEVTITAMYNLLEKLRKAEPLDDKDKTFNQKALVSTLKQIHDELDTAVFDAYGWNDLVGGVAKTLPSPQPSPEGRGGQIRNKHSQPPAPLLPGEKGLGDEGQPLTNNDYSQLTGKYRSIPRPLLDRARELRQTQTPAEQILWECLRDRRLHNLKFRRQHNIDRFIADFYCHTAKLVLELDGSIHNTNPQQERDRMRDEWMQTHHLTVIRITNDQILNDLENTLHQITQHCTPSPPLPPPTPFPLLPREKGLGDEGKSQTIDDQILDRLVKLNADRAEEERNGKVRWLRPDYQAPHETQTQQTLPGMETPTETIPIPTEQQKFPKAFKDQLAAVRDLLRTQGNEWTVSAIAAQFKGTAKQKATIPDCLESLETLGIIARHTEEGTDRYFIRS